ncbi:MAG TPA: putative Ig domain-containing protein, partial [Pseudomonadales bacterium]|nr:putative Ig domain-containing protein [Pseudomonadales bacterium]
HVEFDGSDLLVHYGANGDVVRVDNHAPNGAGGGRVIDTFEFADGTTVTLREFMNRAPEVANSIDDQIVQEDAAFSLRLPDDLFIDADGDTVLNWVAAIDYETAPNWLQYDAATHTLHGTPGNADVGEFDLVVQGMDALGAAALHSFHVTVQNSNDAPEVAFALADQQATEDSPFSFTMPQDAFRDVDVGDVITLSATQDDGSPLPTWLGFDASTGTFSGTPANGDVGSVSVRLTASDAAAAQAHQTFAIGVANVNDAPTAGVVLTNQTATAGSLFVWQLPQGAFVDVDAGDQLRHAATLTDGSTLPDWLRFDAGSGRMDGTPTTAGHYEIQISATDLAGANANQRFALEVQPNEASLVAVPDSATVTEDRKLLAWGNLLANDHAPMGADLRVTDAGIRRGEHGVLAILQGGGYAYLLNNLSADVQALKTGESVIDRFTYTVSDGTQSAHGELAVTVQGRDEMWVGFAASQSVAAATVGTAGQGAAAPAATTFNAGTDDRQVMHGQDATSGSGSDAPPSEYHFNRPDGGESSSSVPPGHPSKVQGENLLEKFLDQFKTEETLTRLQRPGQAPLQPVDWSRQHPAADPGQPPAFDRGDHRQQWAELIRALERLDVERQSMPVWNHLSQGADLSGLAGLLHGGNPARGGVDTLSLACGSGTRLKGFAGLHDGMQRLPG